MSQHLQSFFGIAAVSKTWDAERLQDIATFEIPPNDIVSHFTYVSCGLARISASGEPIELAISSPFQTLEHVELIAMLAAAITSRKAHYGLSDLIQIGRPWIYGARAQQLLVSLPYPYGPAFENVEHATQPVSIQWLLPIYDGEAKFMAQHGVEALEQKFDAVGLDYSNPNRASVI